MLRVGEKYLVLGGREIELNADKGITSNTLTPTHNYHYPILVHTHKHSVTKNLLSIDPATAPSLLTSLLVAFIILSFYRPSVQVYVLASPYSHQCQVLWHLTSYVIDLHPWYHNLHPEHLLHHYSTMTLVDVLVY